MVMESERVACGIVCPACANQGIRCNRIQVQKLGLSDDPCRVRYECQSCGHAWIARETEPIIPQTAHTPGKVVFNTRPVTNWHTIQMIGKIVVYVKNETERDDVIAVVWRPEDAARLCLCWNAHDGLVTELNRLRASLKEVGRAWTEEEVRSIDAALANAQINKE